MIIYSHRFCSSFYVLDGEKLGDTEKLACVRQELEDDDINAFCAKFLDICGQAHDGARAEEYGAATLVHARRARGHHGKHQTAG